MYESEGSEWTRDYAVVLQNWDRNVNEPQGNKKHCTHYLWHHRSSKFSSDADSAQNDNKEAYTGCAQE